MSGLERACRLLLLALSLGIFRLYRLAIRRPLAVIVLTAVIGAGLASQAGKSRFILSSEDLVGESFESVERFRDLKESFREGNSTQLFLAPPAGRQHFTEPELCVIRKWLSSERLTLAEIKESVSAFDVRKPRMLTPSRLYYPELLELECDRAGTPERGDRSSRIREDFDRIGASPWGLVVTGKPPGDVGIQLTFKDEPGSKFGSFDPRFLKGLHQRFAEQVQGRIPGVRASWVGTADYQHYVLEGTGRNSALNLIMLALMVVAMRLLFGTWRAGFILASTLVFTGVCVYGAKGLLGSPFDALSNSLFLMLVIAALEDFIFASYLQLQHGAGWRRSLREMLVPAFLTSLTTFIGFASLCVAEIEVIRRLGLWAAIGSMLEWVVIFVSLPAILRKLKPSGWTWVDPGRALFKRALKPAGGWSVSRRLSLASMGVFLVAIASLFHLNVNDAPHLLFPASHPLRQGLAYLESSRGWEGSVSVVFADGGDKAFVSQAVAKLRAIPGVVGIEDYESTVESLVSGLEPPIQDIVRREVSATRIRQRLVDERGRPRANLFLARTELSALRALREQVAAICPAGECHLAAGLMTYADFAGKVSVTLFESLGVSMLLVGSILSWLALALGKRRLILPLLASSFWGPALMLALVGLFQLKVNFMTCIFATVLVGLTGDNAIQFLLGSRRQQLGKGLMRVGGGAIQCSLVMAVASLLFFGSYFEPPRVFGAMMCAGFLAALFGDLFLLNGLLGRGEEHGDGRGGRQEGS